MCHTFSRGRPSGRIDSLAPAKKSAYDVRTQVSFDPALQYLMQHTSASKWRRNPSLYGHHTFCIDLGILDWRRKLFWLILPLYSENRVPHHTFQPYCDRYGCKWSPTPRWGNISSEMPVYLGWNGVELEAVSVMSVTRSCKASRMIFRRSSSPEDLRDLVFCELARHTRVGRLVVGFENAVLQPLDSLLYVLILGILLLRQFQWSSKAKILGNSEVNMR